MPTPYRLRTLVILLAVAWPVVGCRQRAAPSGVSKTHSPAPDALAKYSFEVRSDGGSTHEYASGDVDLTMGSVRMRVQDGAMTVNGQSYGQIEGGDAVLVQADGQVIVNLHVRRPQ